MSKLAPTLVREAAPARRRSGARLLLLWLTGIFAVCFGLAALALPALVSGGLLVRGFAEGHPSWIVLGGLVGGMWSLMLVGTVRKATAARPTRADAPQP
jgi:hypothetical protein